MQVYYVHVHANVHATCVTVNGRCVCVQITGTTNIHCILYLVPSDYSHYSLAALYTHASYTIDKLAS